MKKLVCKLICKLVCKILEVLCFIVTIIGGFISAGFTYFSFLALLCLIIGFILDLPKKDMFGIMIITYGIGVLIALGVGLLQDGIDILKQKIQHLKREDI